MLWEELRVGERLPPAFWLGVALKSLLALLLLLPLFLPDLEQFDGKGMNWRVLVYPLAAVIVPLLWRATGSQPPYPYLADNLIVLPAISDVLWNTLDAYERVGWWDDVNHLVNSVVFAAVIGLWASRYPLSATVRLGLALGLGMTLQVLWELGEYMVFIANATDVPDAYQDTIGDLTLDLVGSLLGAAFALYATTETVSEAEPALATRTAE